jgi:hypothetical protein
MWTSDVSEDGKALCLDLRDGEAEYIDKTERERFATRLVRVSR